jgi:serine/threonine-protein kinase RsbW
MEGNRLHFGSSFDNINLVERFVVEICERHNIQEDNFGNILIAVTEAVNNAIQHGNNLDPDKNIDLEFDAETDKICFTVSDEGRGFNYHSLPDPTEPENIEKPHGRGVFLMKNLADSVDFYDNGRQVKLYFNLAS